MFFVYFFNCLVPPIGNLLIFSILILIYITVFNTVK